MPHELSRRAVLRTIASTALLGVARAMPPIGPATAAARLPVMTGAAVLAADAFAPLAGKRIGLITNQTGLVGKEHLADLLRAAKGIELKAILAPEHGFRGIVEAGEKVADGRDPRTGVRVWSLYGATRKPTAAMLADVDALVFDIQDVGVRFYTYISTMGLAMQAAAARRIPFFVLDRPNPIGGEDVSGFIIEPGLMSFIGQYPVPIVHGLTVGEFARMIVGERWLPGVERCELTIVAMTGWSRAMRWPDTGLAWTPTSPNIPTFSSALVYPGMGLVGEALVNEGRGTPIPFQQFGAPWLNAPRAADKLNAAATPGVTFAPIRYTPRSIPNVAADPRFRDQEIPGVRLAITDIAACRPLETGVHVLAELAAQSRAAGARLFDKLDMFRATSGSSKLADTLARATPAGEIIASWSDDVARFRERSASYRIYPG